MTTKIVPPPMFPSAIPESRFARNGDTPSPTGLRRSAHAVSQAATAHRKMLFHAYYDIENTYNPPTTPEDTLQIACRTGENVDKIGFLIAAAPAWQADGVNAAWIQLEMDDGTTQTLSEKSYYPRVATGGTPYAYAPSEIAWVAGVIDGASGDTPYLITVKNGSYARIHSIMVYEIPNAAADSSVDGIADASLWQEGASVLSASATDLAHAATLAYKHNGQHLMSWSRESASSGKGVAGASYSNISNGFLTTVTADSPGYTFHTQYHRTKSKHIGVELGIRAVQTVGSGATVDIKFVGSVGTWIEFTGISSSASMQLIAGTVLREAQDEKIDLHVKSSAGTWEFHCIGLWEYEA